LFVEIQDFDFGKIFAQNIKAVDSSTTFMSTYMDIRSVRKSQSMRQVIENKESSYVEGRDGP
jgi:hypothetical protein